MDRFHSEIILSNIDTIAEWTDYEKLKDGCIRTKLLSVKTVQEIEESLISTKLKHKHLLKKITETEPESFNVLVKICQTNFWDAADFLASFEEPDYTRFRRSLRSNCNISENQTVERDGNFFCGSRQNSIVAVQLEPFTQPVEANLSVTKAERFSTSKILTYSMKSKNRGVLFLVNIIEVNGQPKQYRNGAEIDKANLIKLFREFGFIVFYYENLTLQEFRHLVDELIKSNYLRKTDCLVFCVLSHGCFKDGHQMIQFSDGKNGSIEDVIMKFSNQNCPNLTRKPKLFIFPMCRGISSKIKVKTFDVPNTHSHCNNFPAFSDIKICYGSVKGFETFRDPNIGSWYIHVFCEILASCAHCEHFDDLHKLIGQRLEYLCQSRSNSNENFVQTISSEDLGFTQHLFFNPGYFG